MAYIGEIIRERRKVEEENKIKRRKGAKRARELQLLKKQKLQQQQKPVSFIFLWFDRLFIGFPVENFKNFEFRPKPQVVVWQDQR